MRKKLSIVIVTYNSEKDIYDCIRSVFAHNDIGEALEVIVVDNCSTDYEHMRSQLGAMFGDRVTIIQNTDNLGYGQGNNVGIEQSQAPIVAIMNPDVRLIEPMFAEMIRLLEQDENNLLVGARQWYAPKVKAHSFHPLYTLPPLKRYVLTKWFVARDTFLPTQMWLSGAFFFVKKAAFQEIGGFDERIFMYGEEADIQMRLSARFPEGKILYHPDVNYLHLAGERVFSGKTFEQQVRSHMYVAEKNGIAPMLHLRNERRYLQYCLIGTFIRHPFNKTMHHTIEQSLAIVKQLIHEYHL